jgi:hypothetical protein
MNISLAYAGIAALAKKDGVGKICETQPDGIWRRKLGDWTITLNGNSDRLNDNGIEIPPFSAMLTCLGWPCGVLDPFGGAIASVGGASEAKLIEDIEAELGVPIEEYMA